METVLVRKIKFVDGVADVLGGAPLGYELYFYITTQLLKPNETWGVYLNASYMSNSQSKKQSLAQVTYQVRQILYNELYPVQDGADRRFERMMRDRVHDG